MSYDLETSFQQQSVTNQQGQSGLMTTAISREVEEVKGQIFMAKQFPRNPFDAERRILDACKRQSLAKTAVYNYPRGGQMVSGPSIRLAEVIAQNWGNLSFGIKELQQLTGESIAMAYAWDLETNTRQEKVFTVKHERHTKKGVTFLKDPRDIYELVANNGARRVRACILGVIPGDIIESAVEECNKTMAGANDKPLKERLDQMFKLFKEKLDVTQEMIEARFGYKATAFTEKNGVDLANIYNSIKDGMSKVEDWFEIPTAEKKESSKLEQEFSKTKKDPLKEAKAVGTDGPKQEELL